MHKETVIAVIIGLLFGLLVTVSIYRLQSLRKTDDASTTGSEQISPSTTPTTETRDRFSIEYPPQGLVTADANLTITGNTDPQAFLVLFVHETQEVFETDKEGKFSIPLSLKEGPNFITLVVANRDGITLTADRVVVYEKEIPLEDSPEATQGAR